MQKDIFFPEAYPATEGSQHDRQYHINRSSHKGKKHRVEESGKQYLLGERIDIGLYGKSLGPEIKAA